MGRLSTGGATYGPAGELLTFNGVTRTYNALGQLTRMTKVGVMDMEYRYTAGQNNGRIGQSKDYVTGEEVTYQYDALNRLTRAETTDNAWGNAYAYDGWGNLTGKSVTKGSAPTFSQVYDPALNMPAGTNWSTYAAQWDEDDRPTQGQAEIERESYGAPMTGEVAYDPSGKRVLWAKQGYFGPSYCEIYFNGITGQRLTRYRCGYSDNEEGQSRFGASLVDRRQHIGGQLTRWNATTDWMSGQFNSGAATTDRLGSVRARDGERYTYFPYGEPRTATVTAGGMFAGLETPVRAYDPGNGRFSTPDPLGLGAVKMGDPASWNRFAYVQGDPVNYVDPEGLDGCSVQTGLPCFSVTGTAQGPTGPVGPGGPSGPVLGSGNGNDMFMVEVGLEGPYATSGQSRAGIALGFTAEACTLAMRIDGACDEPTGMAGIGAGLARRFGIAGILASGGWSAAVNYLGRAGENIVSNITGLVKNGGDFLLRGTQSGVNRIPDFVNQFSKTIIEVKNVSSLSLTSQLRDMMVLAVEHEGWTLQIWVREGAQISAQVQAAAAQGLIVINTFKWP